MNRIVLVLRYRKTEYFISVVRTELPRTEWKEP